MPRFYAHVQNGSVIEVITVNDGDLPLEKRYHAAVLESFIELHGTDQFIVKPGWNYDGSGFYKIPEPAPLPAQRNLRLSVVRDRMEEAGKWDDLVDSLKSDMNKLVKLLMSDTGINPEDQSMRDLIASTGADPDEILKE